MALANRTNTKPGAAPTAPVLPLPQRERMSLEQAQQYLAKVLPWPQEGDALPSYVNIHWSLNKMNQNGKPIWTGGATRSVQEAINTVSWALKNPDTSDIYVCMSSHALALEEVSKKGASIWRRSDRRRALFSSRVCSSTSMRRAKTRIATRL
jgi:hypothetical protein